MDAAFCVFLFFVCVVVVRVILEIYPITAQEKDLVVEKLKLNYIIAGAALPTLGLGLFIVFLIINDDRYDSGKTYVNTHNWWIFRSNPRYNRSNQTGNNRSNQTGNNHSNPAEQNQHNPDEHFLNEVRMLRDDARQILGVSRTANQREIKTAYRKRALATHPNKGGTQANFQRVEAAYGVLKNA